MVQGLPRRRPPGRVPDRLRDAQGRRADRRRLERRPAVLPVALVHGAAPRLAARPGRPAPSARPPPPRRATATRSPACRMPRPPSFNERDMYDKPQVVADRPRLSPELAAGVEENWRQENEALMAVDEGVAQIVDALRRTGQLDNTLIVFLSDNGFMHGEHRALAEKVLPYEESIRVPLVLRGPGVPRGRIDHRLVANVDVTLDDPRRDRRGARPRAGRPLAARAAGRPRRRVGPRHPDRERQRRERRARPTAASATTASCTWSTDHRRDRALRPAEATRSSCRASTATPRTRRSSATSTCGCAHWCTAWAWTARRRPHLTLLGPLGRPPRDAAASRRTCASRCTARSAPACCTPT